MPSSTSFISELNMIFNCGLFSSELNAFNDSNNGMPASSIKESCSVKNMRSLTSSFCCISPLRNACNWTAGAFAFGFFVTLSSIAILDGPNCSPHETLLRLCCNHRQPVQDHHQTGICVFCAAGNVPVRHVRDYR